MTVPPRSAAPRRCATALRLVPVILGVALALPSPAPAAAPGRLTLIVPARPPLSGDPVLVRGRLTGPGHGGQPVVVAEQLPGRRRFARVARTRTDGQGRWSVLRPAGKVLTSRLVQASAGRVFSRIGTLAVQAELTLAAPALIQPVGATVVFIGTLTPRDPGASVVLEQLAPNGRWLARRTARVGRNARFHIASGFFEAGQATLRVSFGGDRRARAASSTPVSVLVEQPPLGAVTLAADVNPVSAGASVPALLPTVRLSGTVSGPAGARRLVTLFARAAGGGEFPPVDTTTSDASGAFSFAPALARTTAYAVRAADGSLSGQVIVGVLPVVTIAAVVPAGRVGGRLAVTGAVSPAIGGSPAELQRQGRDGGFHTIARGSLAADGSLRIATILGSPGPQRLRVLIAGGGALVNASNAVTVTVARPPGAVR